MLRRQTRTPQANAQRTSKQTSKQAVPCTCVGDMWRVRGDRNIAATPRILRLHGRQPLNNMAECYILCGGREEDCESRAPSSSVRSLSTGTPGMINTSMHSVSSALVPAPGAPSLLPPPLPLLERRSCGVTSKDSLQPLVR